MVAERSESVATPKSPPLTAVMARFQRGLLLLLPGQRLVVHFEVGVGKGFRQIGRGIVGEMKSVPCLKRLQRRLSINASEFRKRALFRDDDVASSFDAFAFCKNCLPWKFRRKFLQFIRRHWIVNRDRIALLRLGPARLGNFCLEIDHFRSALLRARASQAGAKW